MTFSLRLGLFITLLALPLVGAVYFAGDVREAADRESGSSSESWGVLRRERERTAELERGRQIALRRVEIKTEVATELIAGRLTLFEAAARFRDLKDPPKAYWSLLRRAYPGKSDAECICRSTIDWTVNVALDQPCGEPGAAAVRSRLEGELRAHLLRFGKVRLPVASRERERPPNAPVADAPGSPKSD
jgi:hypothetical protein